MNIKNVLDEFGTNLVKDVQKSLIKKGVETNAGQISKLGNSVRFVYKDKESVPTLQLVMSDYWNYVEKGREEGGMPPVDVIKKWLKRKAIDPRKILIDVALRRKSISKENSRKRKTLKKKAPLNYEKALTQVGWMYAKAIAKKGTIKRFGYNGAHFLEPVIKDGRVDKLKLELSNILKKDIKIELIDGR